MMTDNVLISVQFSSELFVADDCNCSTDVLCPIINDDDDDAVAIVDNGCE
jgi:hypothetical protein